MRAARPAQQAEAPHERGERDDDDLAFGELFDALRSRLVPSVGTTDAHAEKATIDRPRLDAARARLDQSWTARLEGDTRERHERRLASIRASLARVARRRDAFGDRVRASLARVSLEEDALASDSAARAEATAVRAESVAGAWRAETLGSAATEEVAPAVEEAAEARDALLAAQDDRGPSAFGRRPPRRDANREPRRDALRGASTTSMRASDVIAAIAEACSAAAEEHAGDGGRADRFPRAETDFFGGSAAFPPPQIERRLLGGLAPRDWSARDEELDAAAEALGDAEDELEALRASRVRNASRNALRERDE